MPWKGERDPYRIWLSEIILQQTRVAQGLPYFERFVAAFPTVADLAAAADDDVMKLWEGLGYYSRARNLLKAARMVANDLNGKFPADYAGLLSLPGVGSYTAAAVASFAYGESVAVLDGNVYRVLARYSGEETPTDTTAGKKRFQSLATTALGDTPSALFNQAIMDFGALVCTPRQPGCKPCPLAGECRALAEGSIARLPIKSKKLKRKDRFFHYLVIRDGRGNYVIHPRRQKDIWQGLYQFPLVETASIDHDTLQLRKDADWPAWLVPGPKIEEETRSQVFRQQLTHQNIHAVFHHLLIEEMPDLPKGYRLISSRGAREYAFPRVINRYLAGGQLGLSF